MRQAEPDSIKEDEQPTQPEITKRVDGLMHLGPQSIPDRVTVEDAIVSFRAISETKTERGAYTDMAINKSRDAETIKAIQDLQESVNEKLNELGALIELEKDRKYNREAPKEKFLLPLYKEVEQLDKDIDEYISICEQIELEIQAAETRIAEINIEISELYQGEANSNKCPRGLGMTDRMKWRLSSDFRESISFRARSKIRELEEEVYELGTNKIIDKYKVNLKEVISTINDGQKNIILHQERVAENIGPELAKKNSISEIIDAKTGYASIIKQFQLITERIGSIDRKPFPVYLGYEQIHLYQKRPYIQLPENPIDLYMSDIRNEYLSIVSARMSGLPLSQIKEGTSGASDMVPKKYREHREEITPTRVAKTAVSSDMLFAMSREELEEVAQILESAPKLTEEQNKLKELFGQKYGTSSIENVISRSLRGRERLASFATESKAAYCTHATSPRNAALILEAGTLHSEIEVKRNRAKAGKEALEIANSPQGKVVEESIIAFSLDGLEEQYLVDYEDLIDHEEDQNSDAPKGLFFAFPFLELGSQKTWYLNENTQGRRESYKPDEIHIIDDGAGVEVEDSLIFCRAKDFGYWKKVAEEMGYSLEWIERHLMTYTRTSEIEVKSKRYALSQNKDKPNMTPVSNGVHADVRIKVNPTDRLTLMTTGVSLSPNTETIRGVPTFLLEELS